MSLNSEIKRKLDIADCGEMSAGADEVEPKRIRRVLTHEVDAKIYESNVHELLQEFPKFREVGSQEYNRCITLFNSENSARERRNKVFKYFNNRITQENSFQTNEVYQLAEEILSVLDESKEQLDLLTNWCDLCLPANETSFAEAHRIKIQDFQDYLASGVTILKNNIRDVNNRLEDRALRLQLLFSTKEVLPENREGWIRAHRDLLVHSETNAYLLMSKIWEKVLEDYILYYNYWKMNLQGGNLAFADESKGGRVGDYFG